MTQQEYLEKALQLKKDNPECEIKCIIDNIRMSEHYVLYSHEIYKVELDAWLSLEDGFIVGKEGIDDYFNDQYYNKTAQESLPQYKERRWQHEVKRCICLYTTACQ